MTTPRTDWEALLQMCRDDGWKVERGKNGHVKIYPTSGPVIHSGPPGSRSSLQNFRKRLVNAGLGIAPPQKPTQNGNPGRAPLLVAPGETDQIPDGRAVIERATAQGPHPKFPDLTISYTGIEELLLEDGEIVYQCRQTEDCTYTNISLNSVKAHRTSHTVRGSAYPIETLRLLIRLVKTEEKHNRDSGKYERVSEELNQRKVPTAKGDPWTAGRVAALYRDYRDTVRVRVSAPANAISEPTRKPKQTKPAPKPEPEPAEQNTAAPTVRGGASPQGTMVEYRFPLRPNLMVSLILPADLTVPEAERLAAFVRSLAF